MEAFVKQPFSNVQLELLRTFSHQLSDADLKDLKLTLARFFAERLIQQADNLYEEKKWNDQEVDRLLNTKIRKSK
ncbi:MAG: hypothetical protein K2Q22_15395 [Cytophagales bacterium]|nr:hypothetical protein [Cytophagales bacterium]